MGQHFCGKAGGGTEEWTPPIEPTTVTHPQQVCEKKRVTWKSDRGKGNKCDSSSEPEPPPSPIKPRDDDLLDEVMKQCQESDLRTQHLVTEDVFEVVATVLKDVMSAAMKAAEKEQRAVSQIAVHEERVATAYVCLVPSSVSPPASPPRKRRKSWLLDMLAASDSEEK